MGPPQRPLLEGVHWPLCLLSLTENPLLYEHLHTIIYVEIDWSKNLVYPSSSSHHAMNNDNNLAISNRSLAPTTPITPHSLQPLHWLAHLRGVLLHWRRSSGALPSQTGDNAITASCAKIFPVIASARQSASKVTSKDPGVAADGVSKKVMAIKDTNLVVRQKKN